MKNLKHSKKNIVKNFEHDKWYKKLFSHKILIKDLLKYISENKINNIIDSANINHYSTNFINDNKIAEKLEERRADAVWELSAKNLDNSNFILALHLEFQSSNDFSMAARIMNYQSSIMLQLLQDEKYKKTKKLPKILSVTIYNGRKQKWTAPTNTKDYFNVDEKLDNILKLHIPDVSYMLIDINDTIIKESPVLNNFFDAICIIEQGKNSEAVHNKLNDLIDYNNSISEQIKSIDQNNIKYDKLKEQKLFLDDLINWIFESLKYNAKQLKNNNELINKLKQGNSNMLADTFKEMLDTKYQNGIKKGIKQGIKEGIQKGIEEGIQKGIEEGIQRGIEEGEKKSFFNNLIEAFKARFGFISNDDSQKIYNLKPKSFTENIAQYLNNIFNSNSPNDAYNRISKLAMA